MLTQVKFRVLNFGWIVLAFQQNSLPQKKKKSNYRLLCSSVDNLYSQVKLLGSFAALF